MLRAENKNNVFFNVIHHETAPTYTSLSVQQCLAVKAQPLSPTLLTGPIGPMWFFPCFRKKKTIVWKHFSRISLKFRNMQVCYCSV